MSMIGAQCDELRTMAESVGLAMPQAATLMMEAADTIWELRESVHRERAEADRLREDLEAVGTAAYLYGRSDLQAENAKLRELCADMWCCISHIGEYDVFYYDMAKDGCGISCTVNGEHCCADKLCDRMRELEVDA